MFCVETHYNETLWSSGLLFLSKAKLAQSSSLSRLNSDNILNAIFVIHNGRQAFGDFMGSVSSLYVEEIEQGIDFVNFLEFIMCLIISIPIPFVFWFWLRPIIKHLHEMQEEVMKLFLDVPQSYIHELKDKLQNQIKDEEVSTVSIFLCTN